MKKNTLIVLVIAIIVILIVITVGINMARNGGLFKYTHVVTKNKWTRDGDNLSYEDEHGVTHSNVLRIGDEVEYSPTVPKGSTTTITAEKSGHLADQTIEQEELPWVVLGIADQNNDGINETLLLTTKTATKATITFKGAAAYNNGPSELDRMCRDLYGENARNMNIEDVNNCFNVTLQDGGVYFKEDGSLSLLPTGIDTLAKLQTSTEPDMQAIWNAIAPEGNFWTPDGKTDKSPLGNYKLDVIGYQNTNNAVVQIGSTNTSALNISDLARNVVYSVGTLSGVSPARPYWLSSRGVVPDAYYGNATFGPGYVGDGHVDSGDAFFASCSDSEYRR